FGLYPSRAQERCGAPSLVREDRDGRTSGVPAVWPQAAPGSHVRTGEPLKASKRETLPKMSAPGSIDPGRAVRDEDVDRRQVQARQRAQPSRTNRPRGLATLPDLLAQNAVCCGMPPSNKTATESRPRLPAHSRDKGARLPLLNADTAPQGSPHGS